MINISKYTTGEIKVVLLCVSVCLRECVCICVSVCVNARVYVSACLRISVISAVCLEEVTYFGYLSKRTIVSLHILTLALRLLQVCDKV